MSTATHATTNQLVRALRRAAGDPAIDGSNLWVVRVIRCLATLAVTTALVCGVGTGATASEHASHAHHVPALAPSARSAGLHR
jgi:hypothetical protein